MRHDHLIDPILDRTNMNLAWEQVLANKGAPGTDGVTLNRWARNWEANIERLRQQVRTNTYRPNRPKRFRVSKKGGGYRELSRLTVSDKVLQRAVLNVIDPLFEQRFLSCSHGYRPRRSVATAVQQVLCLRDQGLRWVLDADIKACFDELDHGVLMMLVRRVIKDWFVLNLMELWLKVGRKYRNRAVGVPMGAVIAPLWCNITLHQLDARLTTWRWKMVRYADDFLVFTENESRAHDAWGFTEKVLEDLNLTLNPRKTWVNSFDEGFVFLGVTYYRDSYAYNWGKMRIEVEGRKLRTLYRHPPNFY